MKNIFIVLILLICFNNLEAQNNKSINLKEGQIFDVLPLKFNENADPLSVQKYLSDSILPRAVELGYISITSIPVKRNISIQGNYTPDMIIFGAWKSKASLDSIMKQLELEFQDFHSLRREIWTVFYNTHYELKEDLSFNFSPDKFYIATAYWKSHSLDFDDFIEETHHNLDKLNGKVILELFEGKSPYGYYYNPDYFFITEWLSESEFMEFMNKNCSLERQYLRHINQFELDIK